MMTAARLSAPTCLSMTLMARRGGQFAVGGHLLAELGVAERIGQRRAVDLRRERAEAVLVGHRLRGQRHREVGAAVIGVVERHHRLLAGVRAGDLDRRSRPLPNPELNSAERFSKSPGVRRLSASATATYSSYGVIMKQVWVKSATCVAHRVDDARRRVADGGDGDAGSQVDEAVAVDVFDDAAAGPRGVHRHGVADAADTAAILRSISSFERGPGMRWPDGGSARGCSRCLSA